MGHGGVPPLRHLPDSTARTAPAARRRFLVALLPVLVLGAMLLYVAGPAFTSHPGTETHTAPVMAVGATPAGPFLIGATETLTFTVGAASNPLGESGITMLNLSSFNATTGAANFTFPSSGPIAGWTVNSGGAGWINLSAPGTLPTANGIPDGGSLAFPIAVTSNTALDAGGNYLVRVEAFNGNVTAGPDSDAEEVAVPLRALGVKTITVASTATAGQTLPFSVVVTNQMATALTAVKLFVSSSQESVESAAFTVPANSDDTQPVSLVLSGVASSRTFTVQLNETTSEDNLTKTATVNVQSPAVYNTGSTLSASKTSPVFLSKNSGAVTSGVLTVTVARSGDVVPSGVAVRVETRNGTTNTTSDFGITPASISLGASGGAAAFTFTTTSAEANKYHSLLVFYTYTDPNTGSVVVQQQTFEEPLVVDSAAPVFTHIATPFNANVEFEAARDNTTNVTFRVNNVVEPNLPSEDTDPVRVLLVNPDTTPVAFSPDGNANGTRANSTRRFFNGSLYIPLDRIASLAGTPTGSQRNYTLAVRLAPVLETLGQWEVVFQVRDRAGNVQNSTDVLTVALRDSIAPAFVGAPVVRLAGGGTAGDPLNLGTSVTLEANVTDAFRMGAVILNATHESGTSLFAGEHPSGLGKAMAYQGTNLSRAGIYSLGGIQPALGGRWTFTVYAFDDENTSGTPVKPEVASSPVSRNFTGALDLRFTGSIATPNTAKRWFVTGSQAAAPSLTNLLVVNQRTVADTFAFGCFFRGGNTSGITTASQCVVGNSTSTLDARDGAYLVLLKKTSDGSAGSFLNNLTVAPGSGGVALNATIVPPTSARAGQLGSLELRAFGAFATSVQSNVTINITTLPGQGVNLTVSGDDLSPAVYSDAVKPGRSFDFVLNLTNLANFDQALRLLNATVTNDTGAVRSSMVNLSFLSSHPAWNATGNHLNLSALGSGGGANRGQVTIRVAVNISQVVGEKLLVPLRLHPVFGNGTTDTATVSQVLLELLVNAPTITVSTPAGIAIDHHLRPPPVSGCAGRSAPSGATHGYVNATNATCSNYTFEWTVTISSITNPDPDDFPTSTFPGNIVATLRLTHANGTVTSHPMRIATATSGPLVDGKNGTYTVRLNITDHLGLYRAAVVAADGNDTLEKDANVVTIAPPTPPGNSAPAISGIDVREAGTKLVRDAAGRYTANFGAPIQVNFTVRDDWEAGQAWVLVFRNEGGLSFVRNVTAEFKGSNGTITAPKQRVANATYLAAFTPTGSFQANAGDYVFVLQAQDAMGIFAAADPANTLGIRLTDRIGPCSTAGCNLTMTAGGRSASTPAPLDIEGGAEVAVSAKLVDNGDDVDGSNIAPASVALTVTQGATTVFSVTMTGSDTDASRFTATIPANTLTANGTYAVSIRALDTQGAVGFLNGTVVVAPNLAPVVTVVSGVLSDVDTYLTQGTLEFTVADANLDAAGIAVQVGPDTSNLSPATPTINGTAPLFRVAVNLGTTEGTQVVRVIATDRSTPALTATKTVNARVDRSAPAGATLLVDPTDLAGGKAKLNDAGDAYFVGLDTRLAVSGTDSVAGLGAATVNGTRQGSTTTGARTLANATSDRFTIRDLFGSGAAEGRYTLTAVLADRVGNSATTPAFAVVLDATDPTIGAVTNANPASVEATDLGSGVAGVTVEWTTSADCSGRSSFALAKGAGNAWSGQFPAEATGSVLFLVKATDHVGLTTERRDGTSCFQLTFGDRAPVVALTVTSEGASVGSNGIVRGNVTLAWVASDPEGAQVRITLRAGNLTLVGPDDTTTTSPFRWDSTGVRDGAYTLNVTASDGTRSASDALTIAVRNLRVTTPDPLDSDVGQGESVVLAFDVEHPTKDVDRVVAVVKVPGQPSQSVPLFDDGTHGDRVARDGIWSASFTPNLQGLHTVDLQVTYDDGTSAALAGVHTFRAQGGSVVGVATVLPVLVLGALVIALGAFGLRRWK